VYNQINRKTHQRRFQGNVKEWKQLLSTQLGKDAALLTGCRRVATPKGKTRIAIECANKSARRLLYTAIRQNRGQIKCSLSLSAAEYHNKAEAYRSARRWRLQIIDKGDMMVVKNTAGTGLLQENMIWLDRPEGHVLQEIMKVTGSRTPPPPHPSHNQPKHHPRPP
jgi:hypothetical protein